MAAPVLKTYFQTFTTDDNGRIDLTGILNVKPYHTINVQIIQWPDAAANMTAQCIIGKISGSTVSQAIGQFPLANRMDIQTYTVIGPEFHLFLSGGPANTDVPIQGWVFLH